MISPRIDYWVERSKWAAATLAVASVPVTLIVFLQHLWRAFGSPIYLLMFCLGLGLVGFLAKRPIANSYWVRKTYRWVHDTTQSLVIQIILHPLASFQSILSRYRSIRSRFSRRDAIVTPPDISSRPDSSAPNSSAPDSSAPDTFRDTNALSRADSRKTVGDLPGNEWLQRDNWLLLVAPYVVPLSTFFLWLPSLILFSPLRSATLGFGLGIHLGYVYYHWQRGSGELRQLGQRFCLMFLPSANLWVAAVVFAFAIGGFAGVWHFMVDWITLPWDTASTVWNWFLPTTPQEIAK